MAPLGEGKMLMGAMGLLLMLGVWELMVVGVREPLLMGGKSLHPPGTACWEVGAGKGERDKKKSNKEFDKRKHHKTCNFFPICLVIQYLVLLVILW